MGNICVIYCESLNREMNENEMSMLSFPGHGHTQYEFRIGVGKLYSPERLFGMKPWKQPFIFSLVQDKEMHAEIKEALKKGYKYTTGYEKSIYYCPKCGDLYERFCFCLSDGGQKIYEPVYRCEKCGNELIKFTLAGTGQEMKLVDSQNETMAVLCKKCGGTLKIRNTGYWD